MKSRRFQLVIPQDAFAVMQRMQAHYGGSLSSVVRRGVRMLETLADARENGCNVCVVPKGLAMPDGVIALEGPDNDSFVKDDTARRLGEAYSLIDQIRLESDVLRKEVDSLRGQLGVAVPAGAVVLKEPDGAIALKEAEE